VMAEMDEARRERSKGTMDMFLTRSLERILKLSSRAYHRKLREECETALGKPWAQEGERKRGRERERKRERRRRSGERCHVMREGEIWMF
jgi:hypothetical protein